MRKIKMLPVLNYIIVLLVYKFMYIIIVRAKIPLQEKTIKIR